MTLTDAVRARAEAAFRPNDGQDDTGSARSLVAADAKLTDDKTARLKALRTERDDAVRPEPRKPARPSAAPRTTRR